MYQICERVARDIETKNTFECDGRVGRGHLNLTFGLNHRVLHSQRHTEKTKVRVRSKSEVAPPPTAIFDPNRNASITCYPNTIQDCSLAMGTNEVTESLHHNDLLFDLPLQRETSNHNDCNHFVQTFSSTCILSASKSVVMAAGAIK